MEQSERIDALEDALHRIESWSRAYPLTVFPEPDFKGVRRLLEAGGITLNAVSASNMRHVVDGVGQIARDALAVSTDARPAPMAEEVEAALAWLREIAGDSSRGRHIDTLSAHIDDLTRKVAKAEGRAFAAEHALGHEIEIKGHIVTKLREAEALVRLVRETRWIVPGTSVEACVDAFLAGQPLSRPQETDAVLAERFDLVAHLARQREWSERTFGPGYRGGVVDHIRKELTEIEAAPHDITEWIDVVILACDGAWRAGFTPEQIVAALVAKQTKNEGRKWPDWRTMSPGAAIEHDRSGEASRPSPGPATETERGNVADAFGAAVRRLDALPDAEFVAAVAGSGMGGPISALLCRRLSALLAAVRPKEEDV